MPAEPPPTPWHFPDPRRLPLDDDMVAQGADLQPGTLLTAYQLGLFPMPGPTGALEWFCPVERGVLPLGALRVSRSLRRAMRDFEIRVNTAFDEVVAACASPGRPGGWIDAEVREGYGELHELGWAHSVEAWQDGRLVGGLYGVAIGGLFAGESMFHRVRDASKVALVGLVELMRDEYASIRLLDVQWETPHLSSLGAISIERYDYLLWLQDALKLPLPRAFA